MTSANVLDLVIGVAAATAAFMGARSGAWSRVAGFAGVCIALAIGGRFLPSIVTALGGASVDRRVGVAAAYLGLLAFGGHALGVGLGGLRRNLPSEQTEPDREPANSAPTAGASPARRVVGALCGIGSVAALVWLLSPAVARTPGWPARAARDSVVVAAIDRLTPPQPDSFAGWAHLVADAPYPPALAVLDAPAEAGPPPRHGLDPDVRRRVERSLVRVSGVACDRLQDGTGFVAATQEDGSAIVVTNAHVVAGERDVAVISPDGANHPARLVVFDPRRDVAVLVVDGWRAHPLTLADGTDTGTTGSVLGFPGGKGLVESPAKIVDRIKAVGTDIYRVDRSVRDVFVLAAHLEPGDSGAPFVTADGHVGGLAFAIDPGERTTAFALTNREIRRALERADDPTDSVGSGRCVRV